MRTGYMCIFVGTVGMVLSLSWHASAQPATGPCGAGYVGKCYCSYDAGSGYYYYCKDWRRLTYLCINFSGACTDNPACKCYPDESTHRMKSSSVGCDPAAEVQTSCAILDYDCRAGCPQGG